MSMTSKTTFVCDRDSTVAADIEGPPPNSQLTPPPTDWMSIQAFVSPPAGGAGRFQAMHLCPACAAAFNEFLAQKPT
jgi:hypothetical protein